MKTLLSIAIAPIIIILITIYIKDKYEKEPIKLALTGTFFGFVMAFPISFTEKFLTNFSPPKTSFYYAIYISFVVASFVEEAYKYIILKFLIWKNSNYNEPFDGILYAVYVSLGFATLENILYVLSPTLGGIQTGVFRAIFSVPAHAVFGVYMGYYLSKEKFFKKPKLFLGFLMPFFVHGLYDLLLFLNLKYSYIYFILFFSYIIVISFKRLNKYISISPFKH